MPTSETGPATPPPMPRKTPPAAAPAAAPLAGGDAPAPVEPPTAEAIARRTSTRTRSRALRARAAAIGTFDEAVAAHDAAVARLGTPIWIGGEPTFTDRRSEAPCWLGAAAGEEKEARAREVVAAVLAEAPGGFIVRTLGRQYAGEEEPRWSYGVWARRDGRHVYPGPRDPLAEPDPSRAGIAAAGPSDARALRDALAERLAERGLPVVRVDSPGELASRLAYREEVDGDEPSPADWGQDGRLDRSTLHGRKIPEDGPFDDLAADGTFLICFGVEPAATSGAPVAVARVELPAIGTPARYEALLADLAAAAAGAGLGALVIGGFPPPVDADHAFTTVTPDPGVLEINLAPEANLADYLAANRRVFAQAARAGLDARRFHYNGRVGDSGGGGHVTLGGPTPEASPFFRHPHLLPALVVYLNRHPSLSYLFAVDSVGSSGQAPRPDEGVREAFEELGVAIGTLARLDAPSPDEIWGALAPFLADRSGNAHRAEVNVEKLWNPWLPGRGKLGVVELRAFRMAPTPERAAALAALLRSIVAMLAGRGRSALEASALRDWGAELHDRFALPFYLRRDVQAVLDELDGAGFGLRGPLAQELLREPDRRELGSVELDGYRLIVSRAVEFWPLVGDAALQETGTSRWIDASTHRLEVTVRHLWGSRDGLAEWRIAIDGVAVPLFLDEDADGPALVGGLRFRAFVPRPGLHPSLGAQGPLELTFFRRERRPGVVVTIHDWIPDGGVYDGLPTDDEEAGRRRAERFRVETIDDARALREIVAGPPPTEAITPHCLDLRRI